MDPIMINDILCFVRQTPLPKAVHGMTTYDCDGNANIYINENISDPPKTGGRNIFSPVFRY